MWWLAFLGKLALVILAGVVVVALISFLMTKLPESWRP